jgi:RHS repeat-associated protein
MPSAGLVITRDYPNLNGMVTGATLGTLSDTYAYTACGELKDVTAKQGATVLFEEEIPDNGVGRDSLGRIQQKTEMIQGVSHTYGYAYDSVGRLWQVSVDGNVTATYTFDPNGNRIGGPGLTTTPVYDDQDRLLSYGEWTFTYTANGELRTKTDTETGQTTTYSYDGLGNLREVVLPDGRTIDYVIDGLNRRVGKKVDGTLTRRWLYGRDALHPIAEVDESGSVSLFAGTEYMVKGGVTYRIVKDHLGSPRLIVNAATGAVAQRMDFDEWGNVTVSGSQPADWQPFGFAGGLYDPDTGLVRFGARDYDPATGRWRTKDPLGFGGGTSDLYAYAWNDPVNLVDLTGRKPGKTFTGPNAMDNAAMDALRWINGLSIKKNWEYGGLICKDLATGDYFAAKPSTDKKPTTCTPTKNACPAGSSPVGWYHTHAAFDPTLVSPSGDGNEVFSWVF